MFIFLVNLCGKCYIWLCVSRWRIKILFYHLSTLWDLGLKLSKLVPRMFYGGNPALTLGIAGLALCNVELGKDCVCLEQLNLVSLVIRSYLSKGRTMCSSSRWDSSAGRCGGEWQPSSRWKLLWQEFRTVQAIVCRSQMSKVNNVLACIKLHSFLSARLSLLFAEFC